MSQLRIGNVIRDPDGSMWIVSEVNDEVVTSVSFDSENVSAVMKLADHKATMTLYDDECNECSGECVGHERKVPIKGWKHSKVLAPNVNAFILKRIKQMLDIS